MASLPYNIYIGQKSTIITLECHFVIEFYVITAILRFMLKGKLIMSPKKEENIKKLDQIRSLKNNWDNNGALAFPSSLIDKSIALIQKLIIQPEVFPTPLCTIQFEYDNSCNDHMEIELDGTDNASVYITSGSESESNKTINATSDDINRQIELFYS